MERTIMPDAGFPAKKIDIKEKPFSEMKDFIEPDQIEGAIISSVVPPLTQVLRNAIRKITGVKALIVGAGLKTGLNIKMDNPGTVGADLVVDSVAALKEYGAPCIVIDMGTATPVTVVDKKKC